MCDKSGRTWKWTLTVASEWSDREVSLTSAKVGELIFHTTLEFRPIWCYYFCPLVGLLPFHHEHYIHTTDPDCPFTVQHSGSHLLPLHAPLTMKCSLNVQTTVPKNNPAHLYPSHGHKHTWQQLSHHFLDTFG